MLVIVESEAVIVIVIFELIADGHTLSSVAQNLNKRGLLTMTGKRWDAHLVHNVVRKRSFYAGETTTWYDVPSEKVKHEPILPPDLIERLDDHLNVPTGLITTKQAAAVVGVTNTTINRWRKEGLLEAKKVRRTVSDIDADGQPRGSTPSYYFDPEQVALLKPARTFLKDREKTPRSRKVSPISVDTTPTPEGTVTVAQAAQIMRTSSTTVRKMIEHGDLEIVGQTDAPKGQRAWLLDLTAVQALPAYGSDHRVEGSPPYNVPRAPVGWPACKKVDGGIPK